MIKQSYVEEQIYLLPSKVSYFIPEIFTFKIDRMRKYILNGADINKLKYRLKICRRLIIKNVADNIIFHD